MFLLAFTLLLQQAPTDCVAFQWDQMLGLAPSHFELRTNETIHRFGIWPRPHMRNQYVTKTFREMDIPPPVDVAVRMCNQYVSNPSTCSDWTGTDVQRRTVRSLVVPEQTPVAPDWVRITSRCERVD